MKTEYPTVTIDFEGRKVHVSQKQITFNHKELGGEEKDTRFYQVSVAVFNGDNLEMVSHITGIPEELTKENVLNLRPYRPRAHTNTIEEEIRNSLGLWKEGEE